MYGPGEPRRYAAHRKDAMPLRTALITLLLLLPSQVFSQETSPKIAELEKKIEKLEARVKELESLEVRVQKAEKSLSTIRSRQRKELNQNKGKALAGDRLDSGKSPLVLNDWSFSHQNGEFNQSYYNITLQLKNNSKKTIKLVEGSVQFYDLLDDHLYGIKVTPDMKIGAGDLRTESGQYRLNQFMNKHHRMKNMKKSDIKAKLNVERIVFTDNTVLKVSR